MSLGDNGIDLAEQEIYHAAVVPNGKEAALAGIDDPLREYGHYVQSGLSSRIRTYRNRHLVRPVTAISLRDLLMRHPSIDLLDMDVQGMEAKLLESVTADHLNAVRLIHVGTHSRKIEDRLRKKFSRIGWKSAFSYPCYSQTNTPFGSISFEDGVETWTHPNEEAMLRHLLLDPVCSSD
jgi:FkbM family methyltransferase